MIKSITKKTNNKKGFTLIELIVVIAILGILAAIAIPRFAGIQDSSKINADAATAKSIISAARIYDAQENATLSATNDNLPATLFDISVTPQTGGAYTLGTSGTFYTVTFGASGIHVYNEGTSKVVTTP